jgi:hypothetical protein
VRALPQGTIGVAGQERIEGNRDEKVLPHRVEGRRPLSRFIFTLPCLDQLYPSGEGRMMLAGA